ncbi:MAG: acetylornithine deacetylase [Bryobacteraceae bacterium]
MKTAAEILIDLVSIPSVSSMSNWPVIEHVLQYLDGSNWRTDVHSYRDEKGTEKVNLVAHTKSDFGESELALVCHTDTVPFDAAWNEAVRPVCRDGRVYGRGSCDVKGFLACVLRVVSQVDLAGLSRPLAVVFTADEEVGCIGAKYLASQNAFKSRYMIIGEPTGLAPVRAGKGYAMAEITVRGKAAHSAFPAKGRSAIRDAARVLERLDNVAVKLASRTNSDFDPPFTTLNAGLIRGGSAKNIVPAECRITVEWRPIPGQDAAWAGTLIGEELEGLGRELPGFDAELQVTRLDPAFTPSETCHLANLFESLTQRPSITVPFGTEATHLGSLTSEAIVFGPGDMTVAHRSGEFVPVEELRRCVAYLGAAIEQLCGTRCN